MAPEDRVRADPALAVVDDRALVVGPQQHHRAVEREQLLLAEPLDLTVRNGLAVADHAAEIALRGHRARHGGGRYRRHSGAPAERERAARTAIPAGEEVGRGGLHAHVGLDRVPPVAATTSTYWAAT